MPYGWQKRDNMFVIIDYLGSFTYNLYQSTAKMAKVVEVLDHRKVTPEKIANLKPQGIFLSSGPGLPQDNPTSLAIVKEFYSLVPILGISLGHLAIAEAFGAKIEHVKTIEHGKTALVHYEIDPLFEGVPNPFTAGFFHTFEVSQKRLPKTLKILAQTQEKKLMALKHCDYPCYGVQFYPDSILTPEGDQILANFIQLASGKLALS